MRGTQLSIWNRAAFTSMTSGNVAKRVDLHSAALNQHPLAEDAQRVRLYLRAMTFFSHAGQLYSISFGLV